MRAMQLLAVLAAVAAAWRQPSEVVSERDLTAPGAAPATAAPDAGFLASNAGEAAGGSGGFLAVSETADEHASQATTAAPGYTDMIAATEEESLPSSEDANDVSDVVEGLPTHTPTETHAEEDPAQEMAAALEDAIPEAPEPNVSARDDLVACNCDCCVAAPRDKTTPGTNWTCTTGVLFAEDQLACDLTGVVTCNAEEPLDYTLFCRTHCRPVSTEIATQCMPLSDQQLATAKKDGTWTDPLVPAIEELPPGVKPDGSVQEVPPAPPTSSPSEQEDVAAQKEIVDALWAPDGPVQTAQTSLQNAKNVA